MRAAGLLLAIIALSACGERRASCPTGATGEPGTPAPRRTIVTAEGVTVHYPAWLDRAQHATARATMFAEVRDVEVEADPRIPAGTRGAPRGATVVVLDPGPYAADYSETGLAAGEWRWPSTVYVAWRGCAHDPRRLPALAHELRHLLTNDPDAGH